MVGPPRSTLEAKSLETDVDLGVWHITRDRVSQYLDSVDDGSQEYFQHGLAPPLALCAYTLAALLEKLNLPPGAIHSLQEMETIRPLPIGEKVRATARVERPRRRGNLEFITISYRLENSQGLPVQAGKTTVLVTGAS